MQTSKLINLSLLALCCAAIFTTCNKEKEQTEIKVNSVEILSDNPLQIEVDASVTLAVQVLPKDATDKSVKWESSNDDIVMVNKSGKIIGVSKGIAEITATSASLKSKSSTITVKVVQPVPVKSISLSNKTLETGDTITVSAVVTPANFTNILTWTIANNSIADIIPFSGNKCQVVGKTKGTTTLTVTSDNGKTATCILTVNKKGEVTATAITLANKSMYIGETVTVSAGVTPTNFTNPLSWTVANSNIATIAPVSGGKDCKVTGKANGTTTLTATVDGKTATCTLTVLAPTITLTDQTILVGDILTVTAEVTPSTLTISPTWTIANSSIATIAPISGSKQCKVTGVAAGTTRLTITANGGTAYCDIKVIAVPANGVFINGVVWAKYNVAAPGTFATTSQATGMFYQWNRKIGWSATDPMINSNGGSTWNSSNATGTTWAAANDPSPTGWRVPTSAEIGKLLNTSKVTSVWTTQSGVAGRLFTDIATNKTLFLPVTGGRMGSTGRLNLEGARGSYWSEHGNSDGETAYYFYFTSNEVNSISAYRIQGYSVRPVLNQEY